MIINGKYVPSGVDKQLDKQKASILSDEEKNNEISTFESILAGLGSGLLQIPKGVFSLGATLVDMGAGTNKAAQIEKYFDDLTTLDEKARATTAGKITEMLVNIGIPGGVGFKIGQKLAGQALRSKRAGTYFTMTDEKGKILLITRFGAQSIEDKLPEIIQLINKHELNVIWMCNPMHGNTFKNDQGIKTRHFNTITKEIELFMKIHKKMKSIAGGIHIEFTSENVTECLGGFQNIENNELLNRYETACDPRLNNEQSLEIAFLISKLIKQRKNNG